MDELDDFCRTCEVELNEDEFGYCDSCMEAQLREEDLPEMSIEWNKWVELMLSPAGRED